jgi:hypothetical protein
VEIELTKQFDPLINDPLTGAAQKSGFSPENDSQISPCMPVNTAAISRRLVSNGSIDAATQHRAMTTEYGSRGEEDGQSRRGPAACRA